MKKSNFVLSISLVCLLVGSLGYSIGVGVVPNFSDYHLDQSTADYSYMICTDGDGWYWAVNGSDGSVCWTSTNASYTINTAIVNGQKIVVREGLYYIETKLTGWHDNVEFFGSGNSTVFIQQGAIANLLDLSGELTNPLSSIRLSSFSIIGNQTDARIINADYVYPFYIDHVFISKAGSSAGSPVTSFNRCYLLSIDKLDIVDSTGIKTVLTQCNGFTISNSRFGYGNGYGIKLSGVVSGLITGTSFEQNGWQGVYFDSGDNANKKIELNGNYYETNANYHIDVEAGNIAITVYDEYFNGGGTTSSAVYVDAATGTTIRDCFSLGHSSDTAYIVSSSANWTFIDHNGYNETTLCYYADAGANGIKTNNYHF